MPESAFKVLIFT